MSQTIEFDNFNGNIISQVKLTADVPAAALNLPVQNSINFVADVPILIGNPGSPTCEMLTADNPHDNVTATVTTPILLPHNSSEQMSVLIGTNLKIYRASDQYGTGRQPDDAEFSFLAQIVIDPTQANTVYTDATSGNYWYKYTFFNSTSSTETSLADSEAVQAGQIHYVSLSQIRDSAGFSDAPQVTDSKISRFRDAAEKEVNGAMAAIVDLPFTQPINPIIVQITKNIAAGELMQDEYNTISPVIAAQGATKSTHARQGGGGYTSLQDLVERTVVLQDANYADITKDDAPGFRGYPDDTANNYSGGDDNRQQFSINEIY